MCQEWFETPLVPNWYHRRSLSVPAECSTTILSIKRSNMARWPKKKHLNLTARVLFCMHVDIAMGLSRSRCNVQCEALRTSMVGGVGNPSVMSLCHVVTAPTKQQCHGSNLVASCKQNNMPKHLTPAKMFGWHRWHHYLHHQFLCILMFQESCFTGKGNASKMKLSFPSWSFSTEP